MIAKRKHVLRQAEWRAFPPITKRSVL